MNEQELINSMASDAKTLNDLLDKKKTTNNDMEKFPFSHNHIIFGAPGTGKSYKLNVSAKKKFGVNFERVTFHPNYSYAQFVGTYKPVSEKKKISNTTEESKEIVAVLQDKNKTAQEKYDLLYDKFKDNSLTRLPLLLGLYCDDDFKTKKKDGTSAANDNNVESNHGKAIRPYVTLGIEDVASSEISYEYVPGPFIRTYIKAIKEKMKAEKDGSEPKNFLLLIEEINRANVAAVFGDVFQLLDRNATGESEYPITVSEDLKNYLHDEGIDTDTIAIPSNMYIWATMNSADQGVMPMDAAFKRRWDFEYLDIDDDEAVKEAKKYDIPIKRDGSKFVNWNEFRTELNKKLADIGVNEDKLLGPFFLSEKSLKNAMNKPKEFISLFKSKVIMYLFEDVVKMNPTKLFVCEGAKKRRYSKICEDFDTMGLKIFGIDLGDTENKSATSPETETPEATTEE